MSGLVYLKQLSNDDGYKSGIQTQYISAVPEAPTFSGIPDIDSLLGGDGSDSLLDLQPSQWLPSTQTHGVCKPISRIDKTSAETKMSEKGDCDDVNLGSQYPLIHSIGASQLPKDQSWRSNNKIQTTGETSFARYRSSPYDRRAQALPQRKGRLTHIASRVKKRVNNDLGTENDLFAEAGNTPAVSLLSSPGEAMDELYTPSVVQVQPVLQHQCGIRLRSVTEISQNFHQIFRYPHFNMVQSKVFDDVMYTDKSLVLCSPTGSGKTAVFEMAIVRLLSTKNSQNLKVVYMAPIKALCSERYTDWREKFEPFNLRVMELTGDTENDDFFELQRVNIILTTPEKWDSMTRKWRDNKTVMQSICLFLVDEIHVLNDPTRGAVVEAVISRMKTIQAARQRTVTDKDMPALRFVALSATITNIKDIANWLGSEKAPALHFKFDDTARPVRLRKVVLGYHFSEGKRSEFQFDISLSYKLAGIINTYNENKPSLIFCATRKGVMQAADILAKDVKSSYLKNSCHRLILQNNSFRLKDVKLRDLVGLGIGYHHAGMDINDRKGIEEMFANGELPVLVATSTLAMGVNLPAHLVIVKSTMYYNMGTLQEYSDTQVLQMIGRAGRPQFDTSATAVIMTKNTTKTKYENLINGTQLIESSLHKNLVEHLNAEIVLNTITDISVAVEWLKYTFLYIRVMKNPVHYGIPIGLAKVAIERRLQDLCMKSLNQLNSLNLIDMDGDNLDVKSTDSGRLMARYYVSFKTAELFLGLKGDESISDLINIISKCEEFEDIKLRMNEKTALNTMNKDKNRTTIRYPMTGKIKTTDMKVNCLIQATLGCLLIHDFALQQDTARIFKAGIRVTRCLAELVSQKKNYKSVLSALLLCKCFKARLWENSKYISKQLDGIGPTLSTALVNAGLTSFEKIEQTNPREIELMVNRHPPFGNQVKDSINKLPKYELTIEQIARYSIDKADIVLNIALTNKDFLKETRTTPHACTLVVGDEDNVVLYKQRILDAVLMKENSWSKKLEIKLAEKGPLLNIHYISQDFVGLDVECTYTPYYHAGFKVASSALSGCQPQNSQMQPEELNGLTTTRQPCNHSCHNKMLCAHECCKNGVSSKRRKLQSDTTPKPVMSKSVAKHLEEIRKKALCLPVTPTISKRAKLQERDRYDSVDLTKYSYMPRNYNNVCGMYSDQPIDVDDYQPSVGSNDDYNYTNDFQHNKIEQRPMDMYMQKVKQYELADQPLQEKCKDDTRNVMAVNKKSDPKLNKLYNRDWDKLDTYIKNRESITGAEESDNDEGESYPNFDNTYQKLGDSDAAREGQPAECEDFAQETDYGIVYVHAGDQASIPDDPLNDGMKKQWLVNTDDTWYSRSPKTREALKVQPRRNKKSENRHVALLHDMQHMSNRYNDPIQGIGKFDVHYEIEEYSDESFEAAQRLEPDLVNNSWQASHGNYGQLNEDCGYCVNIQDNGDSLCSGDFDYAGQLYAKPLANNLKQENTVCSQALKPFKRFDGRQQVLFNRGRDMPLKNSYMTKNSNIRGDFGENVSHGNQRCVLDSSNNDNEELVNTDFLVLEGNSQNTDNGSKWTNFFSSQSSTASDCLNLKYPNKNENNEMEMRNWNYSQTCQTDNNRPNYERNKSMATDTFNVPTWKYGQVLACVSNQDQLEKNIHEEQNGINQPTQDEPSDSRSVSGYPDYSNIFDDIL